MSSWWGFFWLFVLLAGNAFFVAAEFAVISARRSQIEPKAAAGHRSARTALYAMENATLMLATSQLGITVCSLIILNVSEPAIHAILEVPLAATGISANAVSVTAFVVTLVIVSTLHVVIGEMVPKNAAFSIPDKAVLLLAPGLVFISKVFRPVIWALNESANLFLRMFGIQPKSETGSTFTLEEVAHIVTHSQREGLLEDKTGALTAAFEFTTKVAKDLTVPSDKLVILNDHATPLHVEEAVTRNGFSRYLISNKAGEVRGYVHIKDLLLVDKDRIDQALPSKRVRSLLSVAENAHIEDVLQEMQKTGVHLANVHDTEGQQVGVLFLEDIIEELVGEVHDATRKQRYDQN